MSKSHRLELQHKKMLRASIAARPSHTQTIKVERKSSYQGVPQWGINISPEITPSRSVAQKWAEAEIAARRDRKPDYVPVPARDELTTFADDSDVGSSNTNIVNRAISYLRERAHSLVDSSEYGQVSPELANVADALQILTRIGGGVHV